MTLEGKVALVTGGGRGIGRAYCLALLNEGTKVCICDLNEDTSTELIKNLPTNLQANIFFKKADVTDNNDFKDAFDKTIDRFGRIDIVVNNAGVAGENTWRKTIDVNFIGVLHGIKLCLQYLSLENGGLGGFIINTTSVAGFIKPFMQYEEDNVSRDNFSVFCNYNLSNKHMFLHFNIISSVVLSIRLVFCTQNSRLMV
ncbi:15-hydroxyprostaglandin dehydrogenase [NAD(+)] isoform X2 [Parasteatoda tepidariorum]|uniref:15-hydroxyprostaglandin dehydrogenase [NAD(+)] isoform X2 n=1 Tax=Parasteatoda tepidariorum TaxID=114398 RepID=UPI001C7234E5|nr:15-hydroxyprostaglandin dehydrogenase [NAD(+)] isoform X2 [Parasteatoda tepidariorum]